MAVDLEQDMMAETGMNKWRWKRKMILFALLGLFLGAAYWPLPRLEIARPGGGSAFYVPLPRNRRFQVVYRDAKASRIEVRGFRIERDGKIRLLETRYDPAPKGLLERYGARRAFREGNALVVREDTAPFPALHLVNTSEAPRIIRLGERQEIDLSRLFSGQEIVRLRVVEKPLLFFLWQRLKG